MRKKFNTYRSRLSHRLLGHGHDLRRVLIAVLLALIVVTVADGTVLSVLTL